MGKVKLSRHTAGQEVLLDILRGGDCFGSLGISEDKTHAETAIAQMDCCILQISATKFEKILDAHPDIWREEIGPD